MKSIRSRVAIVLAVAGIYTGNAVAGEYNGDLLVRVQGTVVTPDASADVLVGGAQQAGWNADVSTEVIPTLTLTYFFNKNVAAELFCCFARFNAKGEGLTPVSDLGDFWVFPPIVTLQYHFDAVAGFKPYVGAGVEYMAFFGEGDGDIGKIKLDNAWGFALQAGIDVEVGQGWYLNADVKKVWLDTEAAWGTGVVTADVEVDPWIVSLGVGYRFNTSDLFAARAESASLQ